MTTTTRHTHADGDASRAPGASRWLGAIEGYYGPPLPHGERVSLVRWLGGHGFNAYAYAPKDDPNHRKSWRLPYAAARLAEFEALVQEGRDAGVEVVLMISPGLDWTQGDERHLVARLREFVAAGARVLGIAWDDVAPGGFALGASHAVGVAAAVDALGEDLGWITCPTDYATDHPTNYLRGFVAGLPACVDVMWTGPSIVSPHMTGEQARRLGEALGRPLLLWENYPVNDNAMSGMLHLGPYRGRTPDLVEATSGVFFNLMPLPRASRLALAAGARFWLDPAEDPGMAWRAALAEFPELRPLARASRSWVGDAECDGGLAEAARIALDGDPRPLLAYLESDPRKGLDDALAAEVGPWLEQWDLEARAMRYALRLLEAPAADREWMAGATANAWNEARSSRLQLFGIRHAYYPVAVRENGHLEPRNGLVLGQNLTDELCIAALRKAGASAPESASW